MRKIDFKLNGIGAILFLAAVIAAYLFTLFSLHSFIMGFIPGAVLAVSLVIGLILALILLWIFHALIVLFLVFLAMVRTIFG